MVNEIMALLSDVYAILWVDLRLLKRQWLRTLATSLVNPLLYLVAFGYGLGRGISFEGYSYLEFVMPGIIALTAMTSSYNGASSKLHVDRLFYKCFDEYLMAPVSFVSIVIGKTLVGVIRGLISTLTILVVGYALAPEMMVSPLFLTAMVISCAVFACFGVLTALTVKSHQDMGTISTLVILPMTFLSGTFFSLNSLPTFVKTVLYVLPLTHSSLCLRASALGQPFPWPSLAVLTTYGLAFLVACLMVLKKTSV
jgi:ABC-2 type transport system permease protein